LTGGTSVFSLYAVLTGGGTAGTLLSVKDCGLEI